MVVDLVRSRAPAVVVERLVGSHSTDDDRVFRFGPASNPGRVRIDTGPNGRPPFLVEAEQRFTTDNPEDAADVILAWLGPASPTLRRFLNVRAEGRGPYTCPCCGHRTLPERGSYELCSECGWEDDGQDDHDADAVRGGPNGPQSLSEARDEYVRRGGSPQPHAPPVAPA